MFIFPDRENTGNLPKTIKDMFLYRQFTFQIQPVKENFEVLKIKECAWALVRCHYNLLAFVIIFFEFGDI